MNKLYRASTITMMINVPGPRDSKISVAMVPQAPSLGKAPDTTIAGTLVSTEGQQHKERDERQVHLKPMVERKLSAQKPRVIYSGSCQ